MTTLKRENIMIVSHSNLKIVLVFNLMHGGKNRRRYWWAGGAVES
jgi:hypothetical protein